MTKNLLLTMLVGWVQERKVSLVKRTRARRSAKIRPRLLQTALHDRPIALQARRL